MTSHGPTMKKPRLKPSKPVFSKVAHGYQKKGIKFLLTHGAAALLLDPGMGKTAVVLKALDALNKAKTNRKTLVIAPLRVCQLVWPEEPKEWEDLKHIRVGLLHGPKKQEVLDNVDDYDLLVINPEGLEWLIHGGRAHNGNTAIDMTRWRGFKFDTLVIDELTKFKHAKGVRFKMLKKVLPSFIRRWGLTGTPAPNGLMDLFGQMYVLDLGNALGQYITHYRTRYFTALDRNGWNWAIRPGGAEEIYEAIRPLAMRASAEDHLELPEIMPLKILIDLPAKVRKLYDTLEDELLAMMEDQQLVAGNSAAASTKCRQIANGAVYVDDDLASRVQGKKRQVMPLHDLKMDALAELVDELSGAPVLVAYEFNHDEARLRKKFPDAVFMSDATNKEKAMVIEKAWNNNEIAMLCGHPASMGHGLNFQKGSAQHVIWFSMFWDLELYDQFIKRIRRQGNKAKRVFVHHIIARDTIDVTVFHVQRAKTRTQTALLDALKERRRG
jgi:SNF2 family DNA or RNA helicase